MAKLAEAPSSQRGEGARQCRYQSTRGGERGLLFEDILLRAYASDGGLYVPETVPLLTQGELRSWATLSFPQVCARIVSIYTGLELELCEGMTARAFSSFNGGGTNPPLPLKEVGGFIVLETGEGPTLAFKDIGQQVVAQLLNHVLGKRKQRATILVETSGDTGPAAVAAVKSLESVDIFCLYPKGRVSPVQELQLTTVDSPNVRVFRTHGDTDEQAEVLKSIFMDAAFVKKHNICSINSINWARIMAQSAYYFWAYLQLRPRVDGEVDFVVPTGAFGNSCGGFVAKTMGLPIRHIVCATNANDAVHRALTHGDLAQRGNLQTVSPAMDIQFAYNLERAIYFSCNGDSATVRRYMGAVEANRKRPGISLDPLLLRRLQQTFRTTSVSDEETLHAMQKLWKRTGYVACPHSACAIYAAEAMGLSGTGGTFGGNTSESNGSNVPAVCVLTAHPAKFEDAVAAAIGEENVPEDIPEVKRLKSLPDDKFTALRRAEEEGGAANRTKLEWMMKIRAAVEARAAAVTS